jgi:hypothetical protein
MTAPALRSIVSLLLLLTACAPATTRTGTGAATSVGTDTSLDPATVTGTDAAMPQQDTFWTRIAALCGQAFEGRLVLAPPDDPWRAADRIVMHVRECSDREIRIPLHIDDNRSRTWVLTRTAAGLRLKHDHRLETGEPDAANTQYGGDTAGPGSIWRQEFPADAYSVGVVPARASQLWFLEVRPGDAFVYGLRREATGMRYLIEFDLTRPVAAPPPPWGAGG